MRFLLRLLNCFLAPWVRLGPPASTPAPEPIAPDFIPDTEPRYADPSRAARLRAIAHFSRCYRLPTADRADGLRLDGPAGLAGD
jgi:hypothetical protein